MHLPRCPRSSEAHEARVHHCLVPLGARRGFARTDVSNRWLTCAGKIPGGGADSTPSNMRVWTHDASEGAATRLGQGLPEGNAKQNKQMQVMHHLRHTKTRSLTSQLNLCDIAVDTAL
jgi:hypothetical protein